MPSVVRRHEAGDLAALGGADAGDQASQAHHPQERVALVALLVDRLEVGQQAGDDRPAADGIEPARVPGPTAARQPAMELLAPVRVEEAAAVERVDEHVGVDLVAEQEVSGHPHPRQRHAQAPAHLHGEDRQRDRDAQAPVDDLGQQGVARVVVVVTVALEAAAGEQVGDKGVEGRRRAGRREVVELGHVGAHVEPRLGVGRHQQGDLVERYRLVRAPGERLEPLGRLHAVTVPSATFAAHVPR